MFHTKSALVYLLRVTASIRPVLDVIDLRFHVTVKVVSGLISREKIQLLHLCRPGHGDAGDGGRWRASAGDRAAVVALAHTDPPTSRTAVGLGAGGHAHHALLGDGRYQAAG